MNDEFTTIFFLLFQKLTRGHRIRYNNKMLFVTSSFVGCLIGHILFMKQVGLILVCIQQNNFIRSNKYLVSEFRNSMLEFLVFSYLLPVSTIQAEYHHLFLLRNGKKWRGLNRNKRDPPILLLPFFRKKRRIRIKLMKRKRSE